MRIECAPSSQWMNVVDFGFSVGQLCRYAMHRKKNRINEAII